MRRVLCNHTKKVSCNNSAVPLRRCLQDNPSSLILNNKFALADQTNLADNNKLSSVNVHVCEEGHTFINMKWKYESPETKENRKPKRNPILLESNMNNTQNKSISLRKTRQKPVKLSNSVICSGSENCENELPSSRKSKKKCKLEIVKDETQKIKNSQKCENEKNSDETVKQASDKQNLIQNDKKGNCINVKEIHTVKNNFQEALRALENTPIRKSTRLQKKQNNEESKTKAQKVCNSIINKYKKHENSENVQSVLSESGYNKTKCESVSSEKSMKQKCLKEQTHIPLYKNETVHYNISEDRLAVYNFEYDENEEPCIKKKTKKRIYNKKPKLCSQNLTINKIKFGSTSSLNSTKSKFGSTSSINSVHSEYNCLHNEKEMQVQKRRKPTAAIYESKKLNNRRISNKRMTKIFEISPRHNFSLESTNNSKKFGTCSPLHNHISLEVKPLQKDDVNTPSCTIHNIDTTNIYSAKNESHNTIFAHSPGKLGSSNFQVIDCCSNNILYTSIQKFHCSNMHDVSSVSSGGLNFSTPCKLKSDIAYNNSIFDGHESFSSLVQSDKRCGEHDFSSEDYNTSNFFGLDTNESIEEPLLSSIKKNLISSKKDALPATSCKREIFPANNMSIQNIIQLLQSEVNQEKINKSEVKMVENSEESCQADFSLSGLEDNDKPEGFRKPPRRSYERIRHYWEQKDVDEEEKTVEEELEEVLELEAKKHHKKKAKSHAEPPRRSYERIRHYWEQKDVDEKEKTVEEEVEEVLELEVKKHHKKTAKSHAEEEAEKLAAKLNCQFQEIDKFNLCVE